MPFIGVAGTDEHNRKPRSAGPRTLLLIEAPIREGRRPRRPEAMACVLAVRKGGTAASPSGDQGTSIPYSSQGINTDFQSSYQYEPFSIRNWTLRLPKKESGWLTGFWLWLRFVKREWISTPAEILLMPVLSCFYVLTVSPQFLFWLGFAGLFYIYAGYPLCMVWLARNRQQAETGPALPFDILMASYSEGEAVLRKLQQLLKQEGIEHLERILLVVDGPDDELDQNLRAADLGWPLVEVGASCDPLAIPSRHIVLIHAAKRQGKPACLNQGLAFCRAAWTVLMDIRQEPAEGCLLALQAHFQNPQIRVVSGNLELRNGDSGGLGFYWKYEKWIRQAESGLGCVPGATGACYAMRREEGFRFVEDLVLDDVWGPMWACRQGGDCLFEPRAVVLDELSSSEAQERVRKRRTIGGVFQLVARQPGWIFPGVHPFWFSFLSHKVLRLAGPVFLLLALGGSMAASARCPGYRWLMLLQLAGYGMAAMDPWLQRLPMLGRVSGVARVFLVLNFTVISGFSDWISGRLRPDWIRAYAGAEVR